MSELGLHCFAINYPAVSGCINRCTAPDKQVSGKYFSYFSMKTYVGGTH